jgi:hypothetical protein
MSRYRRDAGATFSLKYHLVWCTKYRRKVLVAPYDTRLREIIAEVAIEAEMTVHAVEVMPITSTCSWRLTRRWRSPRSSTASRAGLPG